MKYTIYKTNTNLGNLRWWRNYDINHRNLPDIDIETYLTNNSITWVALTNSRNEPIKYESVSKDSFDEIELYLPNLEDAPDYIKITYTKADSSQESLYYYLDNVPTLYNAVNRLNAIVRYTLDKYVGFYKFHAYLKDSSVNPQMFFVQKHHHRYLQDSGSSTYYFDVNSQPWYLDTKDNTTSVVKECKRLNNTYLIEHLMPTHTTGKGMTFNGMGLLSDTNTTALNVTPKYFYSGVDATIPTKTDQFLWKDNIFNWGVFYDTPASFDGYQYIVTKPKLWTLGTKKVVHLEDSYLIWPIVSNSISSDTSNHYYFGWKNNLDDLYEKFPLIFNDSNIVGRFYSYYPPSFLSQMHYKDQTPVVYEATALNGCAVLCNDSNYDNYNGFYCIISNGLPVQASISDTYFNTKISTLRTKLRAPSTNTFEKTKENNPHLLAPQYLSLSYNPTTNDKIEIGLDSFRYDETTIQFGLIPSTYFYTRIIPTAPSLTKILSTAGNEFAANEHKQVPIQCDAWNNTFLQRQALDTSRNTTIASNATALSVGALSTILGIILSATGVGAPLGAGAIIGGIGSLVKGGVSLSNGLAQNEQQQRNLYNQSNSLNTPVGISGLSARTEWDFYLYSKEVTDNDANIINSEDNMYGYKITSWLPYADYLTCWDGNYMLCDMSKNYNNIFSKLKSIDSLWTISDSYINQFIDALNNGVTWFDGGNYVDLATDEYNWERTFTRHS